MNALAWRIARNREIAGFHYASDSAAGRDLAKDILAVLSGMPQFNSTSPLMSVAPLNRGLFVDAAAEWS